jgi:hypothetical protein
MLGDAQRLRLQQVPQIIRASTASYWLCVVAVSVLFYVVIVSRFGFRFDFVSFNDVYDVRAAYVDALADAAGLTAYAVSWQGYVINPLLIGYGLVRSKLWMIAAGVAGQVMIYSITGSKSVFLSGVFLVALWIALRQNGKYFGLVTVFGLSAVVAVCTVVDWQTGGITLTSLFVRRVIITPGLLTGYYFDFFSHNPKLLLSHSVFRFFLDYPYDLSPTHLIGYVYFGSAAMGANANLWADAFANFGYIGLFIFTCILAAFLWLFDSVSSHIDLRFAGMVLGIPAFALANSALLTSFLTHGIALAFLLTYLFPRTSVQQSSRLRRIQ